MKAYTAATSTVSDEAINGEAAFWVGITLASAGSIADAMPYLQRAYAQDARWAELVVRLPASGLLPDDAELIAGLVREMKK